MMGTPISLLVILPHSIKYWECFVTQGVGKKLTTENISFDTQVITEKSGKKVAILPGGFKPPHAGHYGLAKHLSSDSDVDEVVVIIGKKSRFSEVDPKIELTAEQSKKLWDIYTSNDENIKSNNPERYHTCS